MRVLASVDLKRQLKALASMHIIHTHVHLHAFTCEYAHMCTHAHRENEKKTILMRLVVIPTDVIVFRLENGMFQHLEDLYTSFSF